MKKWIIFVSMFMSFSVNAFDMTKEPIEVVCASASSGLCGSTVRSLQEYAATRGITIVPSFKPGAEDLIAATYGASQPPTGRVVVIGGSSGLAMLKQKDPSLNVQSISLLKLVPVIVVSSPKSNIDSLEKLQSMLRQGTRVNLASGSFYARVHWTQALEGMQAPDRTIVSYKNHGQLNTDLVAGHVDVAIGSYALYKPFIESKQINIIGYVNTPPSFYPKTPAFASVFPVQLGSADLMVYTTKGVDNKTTETWVKFIADYLAHESTRKEYYEQSSIVPPLGPVAADKALSAWKSLLEKYESK